MMVSHTLLECVPFKCVSSGKVSDEVKSYPSTNLQSQCPISLDPRVQSPHHHRANYGLVSPHHHSGLDTGSTPKARRRFKEGRLQEIPVYNAVSICSIPSILSLYTRAEDVSGGHEDLPATVLLLM